VIVHGSGIIALANAAAARAAGAASGEALVGRAIDTLGLSTTPGRHSWRRADGTALAVEVSSEEIPTEGGLLTLTVARDVTSRETLEAHLRRSQHMESLGRLAGGVAHDFNNLLSVILAAASFLRDDLGPDHPSARDTDDILASCERGAALTRQLLAFSRPQVAPGSPADVHAALETLTQMLRRLLGDDIELELRSESPGASVSVDPAHLEQIVMNLVVNARDAMRGGGRLTIESRAVELGVDDELAPEGLEAGRYVVITVTDTGVGISEPDLSRLFEPFFTTKQPGAGTGLGLATVHGIAREAGGTVTVSSRPGEGTTFRVWLPRVEGVAPGQPLPRERAQRGDSERVLLVEDDAAVRAMAERALRSAGYFVRAAPDPRVAIAWLEDDPRVDLVITDVVMPGMRGPELVERLRAARPHLRVLYISGFSDGALADLRADLGGDGYLAKPFSPDDLLHEVKRSLRSRSGGARDAPAAD
jgi:two-component system cell cycle sensor histidine kinase/response regulator CckA